MTVQTKQLKTELSTQLRQLNNLIVEYKTEKTECYQKNLNTTAKLASIRKIALEKLKTHILKILYNNKKCDEIVKCVTTGEENFYQISVYGCEYYTPTSKWNKDITTTNEIIQKENIKLNTAQSEFTEQELLTKIEEQFTSANEFIEEPFVNNSIQQEPTGWKYLSKFVDNGSLVPTEQIKKSKNKSFLFKRGNTITTEKHGEIIILEQKGKWIRKRNKNQLIPVYDVKTTDDILHNVPQEEITKNWTITIESTVEIQYINRKFENELITTDEDFEVGDSVSVRNNNNEIIECTITKLIISYPLVVAHLKPKNEYPKMILNLPEISE